MNFTDRIRPTDKGITIYLDELENLDFQIPTFQRDVVWEKENVKKLWDSIYKFYPLGSILVWKTDIKLQNHRKIGGHKILEGTFSRSKYQYILDGQQRTTPLLTSLYGGSIEGQDGFDPSVYIDLTIEDETDTDDDSYKKRFLYWDEINDKEDNFKRNTGRQTKQPPAKAGGFKLWTKVQIRVKDPFSHQSESYRLLWAQNDALSNS